jgi:Alginate lyase
VFNALLLTPRSRCRLVILALVSLCLGCQVDAAHAGPRADEGGFLLFDADGMAQVKQKLAAGDPYLASVLQGVVAKAENYLTIEPVSVTDKPMLPPSGDKHDYMSMSPYWWPNPDTPDGKPYLRRDGEYNPERANYDVPKLDTVTHAVRFLALAYYFTGDERYAGHAARHLRYFFIDPETRMNPNLQFGQFVPGVAENGRKSGIIETIRMRFMVDSITMLRGSGHWTDQDHQTMQQWFRDYVRWLRTSEHGVAESKSENNHGSWYAQQVILYSLFAGDRATALEVIDQIPARIDAQFEPDGSQPLENKRTRSLHYCDFNNRALMDIARMARPLGVDLWGYESQDGRGLRRSLDFMTPYMTGEKTWPHKQIDAPKYQWFAQSFRWAAIGFDDPAFEALIDKLPDRFGENSWIELVVPAP